MDKVIVESSRRGCYECGEKSAAYYESRLRSKWKSEFEDGDDVDDLPHYQSNTRKFGYNKRTLSDHLSPLKRFIKSKIGKKWDNVFAEICEKNNSNSVVQNHVREHALQYVALNVVMIDNIPHQVAEYRAAGFSPIYKSRYSYLAWVHPETNELMAMLDAPEKRVVSKSSYERVEIDDEHQLHKIKGIWYMIHIRHRMYDFEYGDVLLDFSRISNIDWKIREFNRSVIRSDARQDRIRVYGSPFAYGYKKEQIGHKLLRKYNLKND